VGVRKYRVGNGTFWMVDEFLTSRVLETLEAQPRQSERVGLYHRRLRRRGRTSARPFAVRQGGEAHGRLVHDLRRSFVTNARRRECRSRS